MSTALRAVAKKTSKGDTSGLPIRGIWPLPGAGSPCLDVGDRADGGADQRDGTPSYEVMTLASSKL